MAPSTNSLVLLLKLGLISIGAVSLAMVAKASIPLVFYQLPTIWNAIIVWLKPPYLYFVINGIIFIIAATSCSSNPKESSSGDQFQPLIIARTPRRSDLITITQSELHTVQSEVKVFDSVVHVPVDEPQVFKVKPVQVNGSVVVVNDEVEDVNDEPDESDAIVITKSVVSLLPETETKRSVFRCRRWRNLWFLSGHHVPLTRHMEKSVTFHIHDRHVAVDAAAMKENENSTTFQSPHHHQRHVLKSETFKDRTNYDSPLPSPVKIRKDPSLSSDELNWKVEAFIKKFNEDMRLHRQQSMQQYMEMINRGV
ncbi:unnamed protein product [Withania somnifera]